MGSLLLTIYQYTSGTFNIQLNLLRPAVHINLQSSTCNLQNTPSGGTLPYGNPVNMVTSLLWYFILAQTIAQSVIVLYKKPL